MLLVAIAISILCILLVGRWYRAKRRYKNLPGGPTPWPIIGNSHQIKAERLHLHLTELRKSWGDIFTVYFLTEPTIVVSSVDDIRAIMTSTEYGAIFAGRESSYFSEYLLPRSLFFNPSIVEVQVLRKLFMRGIKQYGTHLKNVEHHAQEELKILIERFKKLKGQSIDPHDFFNQYVANVILILIAGQRFEPTHKILRIAGEVAEAFDYLINYKRAFLLANVPFAETIFPDLREKCNILRRHYAYLMDTLENLRKTQSSDTTPSCLFSFLEDEEIQGNISKESRQALILDAVLAGVVTTRPVLLMSMIALVFFPDVQRQVQEEIDKVVGRDRLPCLEDKPSLPYTQAVMFEVFRLYTSVALVGPRVNDKDCSYKGYFIPKGTKTILNIWHINHDEEFWENPFNFDPTRFLDEEGNLLPPEDEKRQRLLTFGLGKRSCVGEGLAKVRIFLALSAILQNFNLERDPSLDFPPFDPREYTYTFVTAPPPFSISFMPRI